MFAINWVLLTIKDLGEEMRYTPVKSSKAKKELHNHVRNALVDFRVPRAEAKLSPGFRLLITAQLGLERTFEEKQNHD